MKFMLLAALAATIGASAPASAYVFKEPPEPGLEIEIPGWKEKDNGRAADMFKDLGGSWEAYFEGPSKTVANLEVVRADTAKFADAQAWVRNEVIGLRGKVTENAFLTWYSRGYDGYRYSEAAESTVKLHSGEPATLTRIVGLDINGAHPNVAFVSFGRNGFWYALVVFNDTRGIEKIDDAIDEVLDGTAFVAGK